MNGWHSTLVCLLLLVGCGEAKDQEAPVVSHDEVYRPTQQQQRVDRSFSDIPIEAKFDLVKSDLTEIRIDSCEQQSECQWRDRVGVRYYFWDETGRDRHVTVKTIMAADFQKRPIPALGIGLARQKAAVLAAGESFVPEADFECRDFDDGTEACVTTLGPGWVTIRFNKTDMLTEVRLDGYHFT